MTLWVRTYMIITKLKKIPLFYGDCIHKLSKANISENFLWYTYYIIQHNIIGHNFQVKVI